MPKVILGRQTATPTTAMTRTTANTSTRNISSGSNGSLTNSAPNIRTGNATANRRTPHYERSQQIHDRNGAATAAPTNRTPGHDSLPGRQYPGGGVHRIPRARGAAGAGIPTPGSVAGPGRAPDLERPRGGAGRGDQGRLHRRRLRLP